MKKLLLSIALCSCAAFTFAQDGKTFILSNNLPVGQNLKNNASIEGTSYVFESPVNSLSIDTKNQTALVLLQHKSNYFNKGILLNYNLEKKEAIWEKPVNLNKEKISLIPGLAIVKGSKQSTALNPADGAPSWETTTDFFYTDLEAQIGIGFPQKKFTVSNELNGINLLNGEILWSRKFNHQFGINSVTPLGKETVLIVTDKIYALNLKDNSGWDYSINSGTTTLPETINLKIDNKYIEDTDYNSLQDGKTVCGLVSDPLIQDNKIYIASEDQVTCLSEDGKVLWKTPLQEKLTSRLRIFAAKGVLYVINTGYAYFDGKKIQYGMPFVAAFKQDNGEQIYQTNLEKGFIVDYQAAGDKLYLLQPLRMAIVDLVSGKLLSRELLEVPDRVEMVAFPHAGFYEAGENNVYKPLISDNNRLYMINERGKMVSYELATKTFTPVAPEKLFRESFRTDDFVCISQNKNSILLDNSGQAIARLQLGAGSFADANRIYFVTENILYTVNIDAIKGK